MPNAGLTSCSHFKTKDPWATDYFSHVLGVGRDGHLYTGTPARGERNFPGIGPAPEDEAYLAQRRATRHTEETS